MATLPRRAYAWARALLISSISSAWPAASPGVSRTTGAPAARATPTSSSSGISPVVSGACRSRPEPAGSRLLFRCTRSIRPVIARTSSTTRVRSQPAAQAWQVSSTKPGPNSPIASHSRATASSSRAMALSPPAVFSISTGMPKPPSSACRAKVLRQLSTPAVGSSLASTWPPCTTMPRALIAAEAAACWPSSLRLGIRIRLLVEATLSTYGACTKTATSEASSASASGRGFGAFQPCGSARNTWTASASTSAARASGPPASSSLSSVRPGPTCTPISWSATRATLPTAAGSLSGARPVRSRSRGSSPGRATRVRPSCCRCTAAAETRGGGVLRASLRTDDHPRSRARGADHRSQPGPIPDRRHQLRWHRQDRDLGPPSAVLRDQEERRGHLRHRRHRGRARRGGRAGPSAQPQRVGAAYQADAARGALTMAGETVITVIGNLTADPELRFTPSGAAVANFTVASTPRTFDRQSQEWKDGEALFLRCNVWRQAAENVAESLTRGSRVIVSGRLKQRSFETKEGEKRTVVELEVDEIGPSLRYATAKVTRAARSEGGGGFGGGNAGGGGFSGGGASDPWSTPPASSDEPPF